MSKKVFLGLILISVLIFAVLSISSCIDPENNPMLPEYNSFPRIGNVHLDPVFVSSLATTTISVEVADDDGDNIEIDFREAQNRGSFLIVSSTVAIWTAPIDIGNYDFLIRAEDPTGAFVSAQRTCIVKNSPPVIESVTGSPNYLNMGTGETTSLITIIAHDVDWPDPSLDFTCEIANTVSGSVTFVNTISANTHTTAVFLFTIDETPGYYDCDFDITATDNIGNVTTNSPVFRIQTGPF